MLLSFLRSAAGRAALPAAILLAATLLSLSACDSVGSGDDPVRLDDSYTDYDAYLNAFTPRFSSVSGRYIHFDDTRYVLFSKVSCRTLPVDSVRTLKLLELPGDVNVREWIRYHNADFGNEYSDIDPEEHALQSGTVRLADVRVVEESFSEYGPEGQETKLTKQRVYYRLVAEDLRFEEGPDVPSVETQEHSCFVGNESGDAR